MRSWHTPAVADADAPASATSSQHRRLTCATKWPDGVARDALHLEFDGAQLDRKLTALRAVATRTAALEAAA